MYPEQSALKSLADLFVVEIAGDYGDDATQSVPVRVQHRCFGNIIQTVKRSLDLFELDAIAHVLDLIVLASLDIQLAVVRIQSHEIARSGT